MVSFFVDTSGVERDHTGRSKTLRGHTHSWVEPFERERARLAAVEEERRTRWDREDERAAWMRQKQRERDNRTTTADPIVTTPEPAAPSAPTQGYYRILVARGLLDNSSPRPDRRALLESLAGAPDAPQRSQRRSAEALLDARTEAAIAASTRLSTTPEVLDAIDMLAHVARAKAEAFHAICPLRDPVGAVAFFGEALAAMLDEGSSKLQRARMSLMTMRPTTIPRMTWSMP